MCAQAQEEEDGEAAATSRTCWNGTRADAAGYTHAVVEDGFESQVREDIAKLNKKKD